MSQYRPTVVEVSARTEDQMYQGIAVARTEATTTEDGNAIRAVSAIDHLSIPRSLT
jgi:hypothetical protein